MYFKAETKANEGCVHVRSYNKEEVRSYMVQKQLKRSQERKKRKEEEEEERNKKVKRLKVYLYK